jgi:hypothetical protein
MNSQTQLQVAGISCLCAVVLHSWTASSNACSARSCGTRRRQ